MKRLQKEAKRQTLGVFPEVMRDNHTLAQGIKDLSPLEGILVPPKGRRPEGGTRMPESGLKFLSPRDEV